MNRLLGRFGVRHREHVSAARDFTYFASTVSRSFFYSAIILHAGLREPSARAFDASLLAKLLDRATRRIQSPSGREGL